MGHFFKTYQLLLLISISYTSFAARTIFRNHMLSGENQEVSQTTTDGDSISAGTGTGVTHGLSAALLTPYRDSASYDERVSNVIAANVLQLALDIGQKLSDISFSTKTDVFSPVSVISALSMLMLGAKGNSYQELKQLLKLDNNIELQNNPNKFHEEFGYMLEDLQQPHDVGSSTPGRMRSQANWRNTLARGHSIRPESADHGKPFEHIIKVANGLFAQVDYSLNPAYISVMKHVYRSDLIPLDFQRHFTEARQQINSWINDRTYGKIPEIINGQISKNTNVILANALYFKAFWENSFFDSATTKDSFYPNGPQREAVKVQMMATGGIFPFYDSIENKCRIIGLPYKGNVTTMYVIQPHQSTRAKLRELQKSLNAEQIEDMISKMSRKTTVMAFPKMHVTRSINMKNVLNLLGVNDVFSSGHSDLSLIGSKPSSHLREVRPENLQSPIESQYHIPIESQYQIPTENEYQIPIRSPIPIAHVPLDRFNEKPLIFNRFSEEQPLNQSVISNGKVNIHSRFNVNPHMQNALNNLEAHRYVADNIKADLYVEDILHKVDFDVNEQGTEAAAATLTYLRRSGTDVQFRADAPFLILIRHDPTKLVLFYAIVNEPEL